MRTEKQLVVAFFPSPKFPFPMNVPSLLKLEQATHIAGAGVGPTEGAAPDDTVSVGFP